MNWADDEDGRPGVATLLWRLLGIAAFMFIVGAIGAFLAPGG